MHPYKSNKVVQHNASELTIPIKIKQINIQFSHEKKYDVNVV